MSTPPLLEVRGLTKSFPGVRALRGVSLQLFPGEVLAVIGENGAGKSTLMKILAGVQPPDEGEVLIEGRPVQMSDVRAASAHGIALIHQELNLSDNLNVGANLFLGREPRKWGLIDKARIRSESRPYLDQIGLEVSPDLLVRELSLGRQQMVEIARALSARARILIMDEPTSSLSQHETENLYRVIHKLRAEGVSIIYISHRLGEVKELADRVTVLRDGENAGELEREAIDHEAMVRLMVGRDLKSFYDRKSHNPGEVVLEACQLRTPAHPLHEVSFSLRAGEIVGLAGLVGAGRTEMLRVLFGIDPILGGELRVCGESRIWKSPLDAIQAGLALVPEDRKQEGLILEMTVGENATLPSLRAQQRRGFRDKAREKEVEAATIRDMRVKTPGPGQVIQYLSGGNQQKVVIGKWLALSPRVLLLDEPTRGIDVGAKQEIYHLMEELAGRGVAILFVSSEMEEVLGMSDRALVMHEGRLTGELSRDQLGEEAIMRLATGGPNVSNPSLSESKP